MMKAWLIGFLAIWMMLTVSRVDGKEIGFIEDFSLAEDRSKILERLIPGTDEYYFYHCLHAQHTGDLEKVRELTSAWIKRRGYTDRIREILNRQALLEYGRSPGKSLNHIRRELNLHFDHRRQAPGEKSDDPVALDPDLIGIPRLMEIALSRYENLEGFEPGGLDLLSGDRLNPDRRRDLLSRLDLPLRPDLADLVLADLQYKHSGGFGSLTIHRRMLISQLDACIERMPALLEHPEFVSTYLTRLAPNADTDIRYDPAARKAYLDRLWKFTQPLPPVHHGLKAFVLYHLLDFTRSRGEYDRDLFLRYLAIPRNVPYMDSDYLGQREFRGLRVDVGVHFHSAVQLDPVQEDEGLVRDYLTHFFVDAEDYRPFAKYIRDDYLKALFAETKILHGLGDMERWYSMMDPDRYRALRERVDLEFPAANRTFFEKDAPVSFDLEVKNVQTLIVKVYELNTFNYYREHSKEVDTAVHLDGLTATWEETVHYDTPPLRRVRRNFEFPQLDHPGVYVIDFIGNGKNSRCLVRKGTLRTLNRMGAAGHELVVLDGQNRPRPEAAVWIGGREYRPDADGIITVPFSTDPGTRPLIIKDGDFAALETFHHLKETYEFTAGFHLNRESLISGREAEVLIRPRLTVNGYGVPVSLLKEVRLGVTSHDRDGVSTTREVPDFQLETDRESVFAFTVPDNLSRIEFSLTAKIDNISRGNTEDLSVSTGFKVNEIDATPAVWDLFLTHEEGEYRVEARGKNGELLSGRPVQFRFKHLYFRDPVEVTLQTDSNGRIQLGPLADIDHIRASGSEGVSHVWRPARNRYRYPEMIHARAGAPIRIPDPGETNEPVWRRPRLLALRAGEYAVDHTPALKAADGYLEISGLAPGDYELRLNNEGAFFRLRVTAGKATGDFLLSDHRILAQSATRGLQIDGIETDENTIRVRIGNAGEKARLHLIATRFVPAFDCFRNLLVARNPVGDEIRLSHPASQYLSGRRIGDEYRYILERKYAPKFPGNLLTRPELLLNPWSIHKTETAVDQAREGEEFMEKAVPPPIRAAAAPRGLFARGDAVSFSNIDFLQEAAVFRTNLTPGADGVVTIDRADLGSHSQVHLLAIDGDWMVYREISLPVAATPTRDLRMVRRLDPKFSFTEQKRVSILSAGETLRIEDIATAEFEVYDSLDKAYRLLETLSGNATLREFGFIPGWHRMDAAEKEKTYSEYASHELNFFLFHKDPSFFKTVVTPYLENKKDQTFMDHWLLGADLTRYQEPWAFSRLNIVEKILLFRGTSRDGDRIQRWVKDRFDLLPPDPDAFNTLFDTALKGSALEAGRFGMDDLAASITDILGDEERAMGRGTAPAPALSLEKEGALYDKAPEPEAEMVLESAAPPTGRIFKQKRDTVRLRKEMRPLYQGLDKTREWVENNYHHLPIAEQDGDLITVNAFWRDFAESDPAVPFFSVHFPYAHRNFPEMMLALAVMDLPFEAGDPGVQVRDTALQLTADSPLIVFHKEIRPAPSPDTETPILVSQNFFRPNDRYRFVENERLDKFIRDEFLVGTPYGCRVVVSNPTSSRQKLNLLAQIPAGALPINAGFYSRSVPLSIEPYSTRTLEYHFYFPDTGRFGIYPVQAAKQEAVVAGGAAMDFHVVSSPSRQDTDSWAHVSQNGTSEAVLDFLRANNLERLNLGRIAFRMKDRLFFDRVLPVLRSRLAYDATLWSYGIYHQDPVTMTEYLGRSDFIHRCGPFIESPLLTVHPVKRRLYEHREYKPLVNARTHPLGDRPKILNDRFYEQYVRFLTQLSYKPDIDTEDRVAAAYYLLLQDRVAEALGFFERIDPEAVKSRIQYDYLSTYLAFYRGEVDTARRIAEAYVDYPVNRWRDLFRTAVSQLDEVTGSSTAVMNEQDRDQRMGALAATEPSLTLLVEAESIILNYRNLEACTLRYYPMDIELLFSRNPFVRKQTGRFAFIRPHRSDAVRLPEDQNRVQLDLPGEYRNRNLMIEVIGAGIRETAVYYAHSLDVQVMENYGYLNVADIDHGKPLPAVYVKVYARMKDGEISFYKDGYTDLRGRFDYASLSTDEPDRVQRFALLVLSEDRGAVTREADPPRR
ncbi:MAG: hypothetical protein ACLFQY_13765 [Desulfococcaceae bacterium]